MQTFWHHLRLTLRNLRRSPSFVLTVVATLGIGIGLNAAIFTVVDCVLLRPLGYHDADRIVALRTHFNDENRSIPRLGGDDYSDLAREVKGLEATAFYQSFDDGIMLNGTALYLPVANVSPAFGEVMGVEPLAGRLFHPDDADGHEALVGAAFARDHFGAASSALGQTIHFANALYSIAGVLPEGFSFPNRTAVWIEARPAPETGSRTSYSQQAIGKRRAGVSTDQLAAELAAFSVHLQRAYPADDAHKSLESVPLQEQIVGRIRPTLHLLMGSVAVILLIVCANIMHLQLVRATRQLRGVTIRTALGASRSALAARVLLEAGLLAAAGTAAAVLIAVPGLQLLVHLAPAALPRLADVHLNVDVFVFAFVLSLTVMAITALLPIWHSWHIDPAAALRQDASRGTESRGASRVRNGLIVAEVALTLALSVCAVLLTRQLMQQSRQDLGFSAESLVVLDAHTVNGPKFPDIPRDQSPASVAAWKAAAMPIAEGRLVRLHAALAFVAQTPGVLSADAINGAPMGFDGSDVSYAVKGRQVFAPPFTGLPNADVRPVTPNLFSTMGIPLLRGRMLSESDRLGAPLTLVINQALARTVFPGQDPIGQQVMCGYDDGSWWTIVGVVGDIRSDSPAAAPSPTFYVPVAQHPWQSDGMQFVVRTRAAPAAMAETLRKRLVAAHPEIAIKATTMRANIGETERSDNFRTLLFSSFAAVSILLAAVGMYGVTAYTVSQRGFEFALRMAVGATRQQVLGLVLRKALAVALVGVVLGVALSLSLVRVLGSVVGKLPVFDAPAYALAALAVLLIAVFATLVPARTAASAEPMSILRSE